MLKYTSLLQKQAYLLLSNIILLLFFSKGLLAAFSLSSRYFDNIFQYKNGKIKNVKNEENVFLTSVMQ